MAIRPVYSKLVLPSRKSLEIIINIKIKKKKIKNTKKLIQKNGGCPLIRACSLIRSNTVYVQPIVGVARRFLRSYFNLLDGRTPSSHRSISSRSSSPPPHHSIYII